MPGTVTRALPASSSLAGDGANVRAKMGELSSALNGVLEQLNQQTEQLNQHVEKLTQEAEQKEQMNTQLKQEKEGMVQEAKTLSSDLQARLQAWIAKYATTP